jgi:hypothetical protein
MSDSEKSVLSKLLMMIPVIMAIFSCFFGVVAYAYQQDMGFVREKLIEISVDHKEDRAQTRSELQSMELRLRAIEIKVGD